MTICKAGSSFQHSARNSIPGFSLNTSASLSFCIRRGRALDRTAMPSAVNNASLDHLSVLGTGAVELWSTLSALASTRETEFSAVNVRAASRREAEKMGVFV